MKRYTIEVRNEAPTPYNRWRAVITFEVDRVVTATEALPTYASEREAFNVALGYLRGAVNNG